MKTSCKIETLIRIMARLRNKDGGCPWDLEQSFETIAPYTIEEAYEVNEAIIQKDYEELKQELGDLLLQVVFHSRIAEEAGLFDFNDVCEAISDKMISRHPHVFGDERASGADDVINRVWEEQKHVERIEKNQHSALDGVALSLPALMRAQKLQKRAGRIGFDWPNVELVFRKIEEELQEFREALGSGNEEHVREEFGDLLFSFVNLGRKLEIDTETALRETNAKFERRFRGMENKLKKLYKNPAEASLNKMEELWIEEKSKEQARN